MSREQSCVDLPMCFHICSEHCIYRFCQIIANRQVSGHGVGLVLHGVCYDNHIQNIDNAIAINISPRVRWLGFSKVF